MTDAAISKSPALLRKVHELSVDPEEIWKADRLAREAVGKRLTEFVSTIDQPFVISLQAPFGSGKTFFLTRWRQTLLKDGYSAIIFDAWKTDFSKDPLVAFISAIRTQLPEIPGMSSKAIRSKLARLGKKAAGTLVTKAVPILTKALIEKVIGASGTEDLLKTLNLGEISADVLEEALKGQEAAEKSIEAFKHELEELSASLPNGNQGISQRKLIILVDELDRCRPDYAISLLECIKHFFSATGVVFVLALDDRQLKSSIRSVYGDIDAEGYLARFIDIRLSLPRPSTRSFLAAQWEALALAELNGIDRDSFLDMFSLFADAYRLSLRTQAQLYTLINLALRISPVRRAAWLFPIVAILKMQNEEKLRASIDNDEIRSEFIRAINAQFSSPREMAQRAFQIEQLLLVLFIDENRAQDFNRSDSQHHKELLKRYVDIIQPLNTNASGMRYILNILDEAEQMIVR